VFVTASAKAIFLTAIVMQTTEKAGSTPRATSFIEMSRVISKKLGSVFFVLNLCNCTERTALLAAWLKI